MCVCVCHSGLLNAAVPGALSERSLHRDVKTAYGQALLTDEQRVENVSNVLAATKQSLDLPEVSKLSPDLFMDGRCESSFTICVESPYDVQTLILFMVIFTSDHEVLLDAMWQIVRAGVLRSVNIQNWPELVSV